MVADLTSAALSATEAVAALRAAAAWPSAPRPVASEQLLPERALDGDTGARTRLIEQGYLSLADGAGDLLATLTSYLDASGSIEGAARALFVHPNTVRYRLRRVSEVTGFVPTEARGAFALRIALTLGRLDAVELDQNLARHDGHL